MAHALRVLTHDVTIDAPAGLTADRLGFLAASVDHARIPRLCRTAYTLRSAAGAVDVLEDGAGLATVASFDDAVAALDARIRLRVLDLAAHSGWLPLAAGLAVVGDRGWLVVGGADARATALARLIEAGAGPGSAEFTLVRSGRAIAYPRPVWLPAGAATVREQAAAGSGPLRTSEGAWVALDPGRAGRPVPIVPRPLTGILLTGGADPLADAGRAALAALVAARVDVGPGRPGAAVTELAGVLRRAEVLVAGRDPGTGSPVPSSVLARMTGGRAASPS